MKIILNKLIEEVSSLDAFLGKDITFLNPFSYKVLRKKKKILSGIDYFMIDGIALVWGFRTFTKFKPGRYSFDMTSLAKEVFEYCIINNNTIYFIGAEQFQIEKTIETIKHSYPRLKITGFQSGYFTDAIDREKSIKDIIELNPGFLVVGMGTPLQEQFLIDVRKYGFKGTGFTCGGFLHQTQSSINYYPKWIDSMGLRWVYRIYDEPKLFTRYFVDYPKALVLFIRDIF